MIQFLRKITLKMRLRRRNVDKRLAGYIKDDPVVIHEPEGIEFYWPPEYGGGG